LRAPERAGTVPAMLQIDTLTTRAAALRDVHAGPVFAPGDEGYDFARQAWNLVADQRPALISVPATAADAAAAVRFARDHGLKVAAQSTGHNATPLASLEDTVLIRFTEMRGVEIDPVRRLARVEAGAEWQDVTAPAAEHGLAALAGSSPDVGVAGYTLGGGMSWLGRKYGLACRHLVAAEVVTADGEALRVDASSHTGLFWALKGGGGAVAVVTALEFRLFPITEVYAGMMVWPIERAEDVLTTWLEWCRTAPDAVTTSFRLLNVPPLPEIPEPFRGRHLVVLDGAYDGPADEGAAVLAPLRALGPEIDLWGPMPAAGLQQIHMDPPEPMPGVSTHATLDDLSAEDVAELLRVAGPGSGSPLMMVELRQLGGALSRHDPEAGAKSALDGTFVFFAAGLPMDAEVAAALQQAFADVRGALAYCERGTLYANFAEEPVPAEEVWGRDELAALRAVKAHYDPTGRLVSNHPVD
jgi:FAD/FMN-containing dehydrogenase